MGAFAKFERSLIREGQREGIILAKQKDVYKGRKKVLNAAQVEQLKARVQAGEGKAAPHGHSASTGKRCIRTLARSFECSVHRLSRRLCA